MNKDLIELINNNELPKILKNYFTRNTHIHMCLNEVLLKDIEEIYIEFDSLYEFDEAEFCSFVITCIKKQDKHDYFYNYLKKVLESSLTTFPKSNITQKSSRMVGNFSKITEEQISRVIMDLLDIIDEYNKTKSLDKLLLAREIIGILQVLFTLYPNNIYKNDFKDISNNLYKIKYNTQQSKLQP